MNEDLMNLAIKAVNEKKISQREAARRYGLKVMTLNDRINKRHSSTRGRRTKLGSVVENLLVELFGFMSDIGFSLCRNEIFRFTR